MRILFAGNKDRGVVCLEALIEAGHEIVAVLAHAPGHTANEVASAAVRLRLRLEQPRDLRDQTLIDSLRALAPDVTVLAGYSPIVPEEFIAIAPYGCINLHGGRLPQYRGSSPLNWALINGDESFTLSVISVDRGVDTGDVLDERTFPIAAADTIADLQEIANRTFPPMLVGVIERLALGTLSPRRQNDWEARYYPLRFPDDGLILWDQLTAGQVHNRVRALTDPAPGAFTFHAGRRITLLRSRLPRFSHYGEPGRVYRTNAHGLLVCASDSCLWIERAVFADGGGDAIGAIARYEQFLTVRGLALAQLARV